MTKLNLLEIARIATESDLASQERIIARELQRRYQGTELIITAPIHQLETRFNSSKPIFCEGLLGAMQLKCAIACGHWHKLRFTAAERASGYLNIIDHLSELVPAHRSVIGLVTYQNGIRNSYQSMNPNMPGDFEKMTHAIHSHFKGGPLMIGLYNPSYGLTVDLERLSGRELHGNDTDTVCCTRQMFLTLLSAVYKINPSLYWVHIAHSEAGLITRLALPKVEGRLQSFLKNNLLVATYGAVAPIPKTQIANARNSYSEDDRAALRYAKNHLTDMSYKIEVIESKVLKNKQPFPQGDHDFMGDTYQAILKEDMNEFIRDHEIYKT